MTISAETVFLDETWHSMRSIRSSAGRFGPTIRPTASLEA